MTILSGLPSAGFGALVTLMLFGQGAQLYAFVGIIMLVGLVKKNGIMMIDFAIEAQRKQGNRAAEAIYEACIVRFRPIMMTTMAALLGTLPIALGWGAARKPASAWPGGRRRPARLADPDALVTPSSTCTWKSCANGAPAGVLSRNAPREICRCNTGSSHSSLVPSP